MDTLLAKLVVTPLLIQAASLAGRRWGETVGGWFIGLPLTSGPVALFLALEEGPHFAAGAAAGSLAGATAEACFCLGYTAVARRAGWPAALLAGSAGFAVGGAVLQWAAPAFFSLVLIAAAALTVSLRLLPPRSDPAAPPRPLPRWDIPARMVVATVIVVLLTQAAPLLGPRPSGLLATYPAFAAVLAIFAHYLHGEAAAARVLRGLLIGLFGFVAFFVVLALTIERLGIALGFCGASAVALAVQGSSFWLMRRRRAA